MVQGHLSLLCQFEFLRKNMKVSFAEQDTLVWQTSRVTELHTVMIDTLISMTNVSTSGILAAVPFYKSKPRNKQNSLNLFQYKDHLQM